MRLLSLCFSVLMKEVISMTITENGKVKRIKEIPLFVRLLVLWHLFKIGLLIEMCHLLKHHTCFDYVAVCSPLPKSFWVVCVVGVGGANSSFMAQILLLLILSLLSVDSVASSFIPQISLQQYHSVSIALVPTCFSPFGLSLCLIRFWLHSLPSFHPSVNKLQLPYNSFWDIREILG